jgi:hypothetical protein
MYSFICNIAFYFLLILLYSKPFVPLFIYLVLFFPLLIRMLYLLPRDIRPRLERLPWPNLWLSVWFVLTNFKKGIITILLRLFILHIFNATNSLVIQYESLSVFIFLHYACVYLQLYFYFFFLSNWRVC